MKDLWHALPCPALTKREWQDHSLDLVQGVRPSVFVSFQGTERVRKSSLASPTVNKTGRKTSAVSFKENNTTIEYSDDHTESSGKGYYLHFSQF